MKPPRCAVCRAMLDPSGGGLVTFARSPADDAWYERAKAPGFAGHPPNVEWFCEAHRPAARALSERTLAEALREIRAAPPE